MTKYTGREGRKMDRKARGEAKSQRQRQRREEKVARRRLKAEQQREIVT
jgi:hypothetical protein